MYRGPGSKEVLELRGRFTRGIFRTEVRLHTNLALLASLQVQKYFLVNLEYNYPNRSGGKQPSRKALDQLNIVTLLMGRSFRNRAISNRGSND